jgi:hypothetical protein
VLSGESLSGRPLGLPAASAGSIRVVIFSFSKSASADSRRWSERLAQDPGPHSAIASFRVIVLESVPKLFRSMAISGIKNGVPQALWEKTILLYHDEEAWKKRLGVSSDKHSYVLLLDGEGRLRWISSGAFSQAEFGELKRELSFECAPGVVNQKFVP